MRKFMNIKNILVSVLLLSLSFISAEASEYKSFELPKIKVIPIQDSQTERQYELYIKLPEGYSEAENKDQDYPVIYIADAMWHMELLSGSAEYIMEDAILVGISWQQDISEDLMAAYGEHVSRFRDYSFWKESNPNHPKLQFGQASNHIDFIRNDVFKYVENNYRTNPNNRSYFGYSMSGLFGAYILMTQPDTFKNYMLGSPSVHLLTKYKIEFSNKKLNANVFISRGTLEEAGLREPINDFVTLLKARNDNSLSIESIVIEGSHQTAFPMTGVSSVTWLSNLSKEDELPVLEGPYLGQKPPGLTPELFAPEIIQTEHREAEAAFSPDLKEFYFRRRGGEYKNNTLVVIQYKDNRWTESVVPPRAGEPFVSPDGKILYLGNKYRERTNTGWSEVKSLGAPFDELPIMRLTVSSKGTYYFDEASAAGNIQYSRLIDGKREKPKSLNNEISMGPMKAHPFIAPDESYLIWDDEQTGGYGDNDLYISFRDKEGSWGAAINLGSAINTEYAEAYGSVSPDGKYFFFHRSYGGDTGDIFWVDAKFLESLRPKQ